jgi:hypothetical protein
MNVSGIIKTRKIFVLSILIFVYPFSLYSQSALGQLEQAAGRSISSVNVPMPGAPSIVSGAGSAAKAISSSTSISNMVSGMLLESLFNNIFSPAPQKSAAELEAERLEKERLELEAEMQRQAEIARQQQLHDKLINSSKSLNDSDPLDFKSLDGEMENMRKEAADQFEPDGSGGSLYGNSMGTAFFGSPLSDADVQIALDPENTPVYKDLKTSVDETEEYIENERDTVRLLSRPSKADEKGEPIVPKSDCKALAQKLERYNKDMIRFNGWNNGTLTELNKWEEQNDEAFWNAVTDGAGAAFDVYTDYLDETRSSAIGIKNVLEANEAKFLQDKIFTPEDLNKYKALLDQRITTSKITGTVKDLMEPWEYVDATRNTLQGTTELLAKSDGDCMAIMNVLKEQGMLSETPWVDAGQFLAGKVIDKFLKNPKIVIPPNFLVKGLTKIPYVNAAQIIVDEGYNVTDWVLSYKNICTFREADGRATEAMRKIRNDMDNIKIQLMECPTSF